MGEKTSARLGNSIAELLYLYTTVLMGYMCYMVGRHMVEKVFEMKNIRWYTR